MKVVSGASCPGASATAARWPARLSDIVDQLRQNVFGHKGEPCSLCAVMNCYFGRIKQGRGEERVTPRRPDFQVQGSSSKVKSLWKVSSVMSIVKPLGPATFTFHASTHNLTHLTTACHSPSTIHSYYPFSIPRYSPKASLKCQTHDSPRDCADDKIISPERWNSSRAATQAGVQGQFIGSDLDWRRHRFCSVCRNQKG